MSEKKLQIKIAPEVADGVYTNLAIIAHSPSEFVMDFVNNMPNMDAANVRARIIMTPENTKKLLFALQENVSKYEQQFGKITLTGSPAPGSAIPMAFSSGEA